jgi:hypothetical protein
MTGPETERDCRSLLGLCLKLGESLQHRRPTNLRLLDSESLAQKVVFHACSILFLANDTRLEGVPLLSKPTNFVDYASIHVLTRSLLETTWAFHHVFVDPETEDERSFRYCRWKLAGFVQRQSFPTIDESAAAQLERDKEAIAGWCEELQRTQAFQTLPSGAKKEALRGERWHPPLRDMAATFLGNIWGRSIYSYLCSYQHADALAAIQIRAIDSYEKQRAAAESSLSLVAISLSNLIKAYTTLWPALELIANRYPDIQELVEMYSSFPVLSGTEQISP